MNCDSVSEQLDAYLADDLDEAARDAMRQHLRRCAACHDLAVAADPTMIFAILPSSKPDPVRVEACASALEILIRQERLQRRVRSAHFRPSLAAVAAAAILVVALAVVWQRAPTSGEQNAQRLAPTMTADLPVDLPMAVPPEVEVNMSGDEVRIYRFSGDEDENTAVLFIVNPALES